METLKSLTVLLGILFSSTTLTRGQFTVASASEGRCVVNPKTEKDPAAFAFMLQNIQWYIPMGSKLYYRKFAEVLLGRPAQDEEELNKMNLTALSVVAVTKASGYGTSVVQVCAPTKIDITNPMIITEYACPSVAPPLSSAPGWKKLSGLSLIGGVPAPRVSLLYTDKVNTLVMSECIDGEYKAFVIMSLNKTLTPEQDSKIRQVIQSAGYDPAFIQYQTYEP